MQKYAVADRDIHSGQLVGHILGLMTSTSTLALFEVLNDCDNYLYKAILSHIKTTNPFV